MNTQKYIKQLGMIIFASLLMVATAWGHSAWLEKRQDEIVVVYGHGPSDDSYTPEKVTGVKAYNADGKALKADTKEAKGGYVPLALAEETAVVTLEFDDGFWSKDANRKWHNLPKSKVKDAKQGPATKW